MPSRHATLADRPAFLQLWSAYLKEQEEEGSRLLATSDNLYRFLDYFESYIAGSLFGVVFTYTIDEEVVAIDLVGESTDNQGWDTKGGKIAIFWGVYVLPEHRGKGLSLKIFHDGLSCLTDLGFDSIVTYVRPGNEHGRRIARAFGTTVYTEEHIAPLHGKHVMSSPEAVEALRREV